MFRLITFFAIAAVAVAEVTEPCADDLSASCVAAYLVKVAGCEAPVEPIGEYFPHEYRIEVPYFNGTIDRYLSAFTGIENGVITALFTDDVAQKTVIAVNFPHLEATGRENIWYHAARSIDVEVDTAFTVRYDNVEVTAQWDGVDSIKIGTARVYSVTETEEFSVEGDFPELAAAIAADPNGLPAIVARESVAHIDIIKSEHGLYVAREAAKLYWTNFLCANLP